MKTPVKTPYPKPQPMQMSLDQVLEIMSLEQEGTANLLPRADQYTDHQYCPLTSRSVQAPAILFSAARVENLLSRINTPDRKTIIEELESIFSDSPQEPEINERVECLLMAVADLILLHDEHETAFEFIVKFYPKNARPDINLINLVLYSIFDHILKQGNKPLESFITQRLLNDTFKKDLADFTYKYNALNALQILLSADLKPQISEVINDLSKDGMDDVRQVIDTLVDKAVEANYQETIEDSIESFNSKCTLLEESPTRNIVSFKEAISAFKRFEGTTNQENYEVFLEFSKKKKFTDTEANNDLCYDIAHDVIRSSILRYIFTSGIACNEIGISWSTALAFMSAYPEVNEVDFIISNVVSTVINDLRGVPCFSQESLQMSIELLSRIKTQPVINLPKIITLLKNNEDPSSAVDILDEKILPHSAQFPLTDQRRIELAISELKEIKAIEKYKENIIHQALEELGG